MEPSDQGDYEAAIGKAIVAFGRLEVAFISVIASTISATSSTLGEAIGWNIGFQQKLDLSVAMAAIMCGDEETKRRLAEAVKEATDLEGTRNQLVHAELWLDIFEGVHKLRKGTVKNRKGFRPQHLEMSPDDIRAFGDEINELVDEVNAIATFIRATHRPERRAE